MTVAPVILDPRPRVSLDWTFATRNPHRVMKSLPVSGRLKVHRVRRRLYRRSGVVACGGLAVARKATETTTSVGSTIHDDFEPRCPGGKLPWPRAIIATKAGLVSANLAPTGGDICAAHLWTERNTVCDELSRLQPGSAPTAGALRGARRLSKPQLSPKFLTVHD